MEIAEDLRAVFELPKGGDLPVRSCGTRWISHKNEAVQWGIGSLWSLYTSPNNSLPRYIHLG